jgi:predicted nucleic acid-binding protein
MTVVFDTSILINIERRHAPTLKKLRDIEALGVPMIAFINYYEFYRGTLKRNPHNRAKALAFIQKFTFLQPTIRTAETLAKLRTKYQKRGILLPLADLLIASQAIEHNATLITADPDFRNFEELKKIIF